MKYPTPLAWFEIVTQDLDRAIKFYEAAFNIKLKREDNPHMKMAIFPYTPGYAGGALVYSEYYSDHISGPGTTIIYLNTDSVTKQLELIESLGGETTFPVTCIGENGYIAGFKDCENNFVGLWSENE